MCLLLFFSSSLLSFNFDLFDCWFGCCFGLFLFLSFFLLKFGWVVVFVYSVIRGLWLSHFPRRMNHFLILVFSAAKWFAFVSDESKSSDKRMSVWKKSRISRISFQFCHILNTGREKILYSIIHIKRKSFYSQPKLEKAK